MIRLPENDAWLSFRLPHESRARLDEIANAQERTRSDLMREVVEIVVSESKQAESPERPRPKRSSRS